MALKKSEKRLLGLLGVVAFIFIMDTFVCSKGDDANKNNTVASRSASTIRKVTDNLTSRPAVNQVAALPKERFENWGKDPFYVKSETQIVKKKIQVKKPNIQGIFEKEGRTYVMVDDVIIEEGKSNNGLQIIAIDGNRITYNQNGRRYTLVWGESL